MINCATIRTWVKKNYAAIGVTVVGLLLIGFITWVVLLRTEAQEADAQRFRQEAAEQTQLLEKLDAQAAVLQQLSEENRVLNEQKLDLLQANNALAQKALQQRIELQQAVDEVSNKLDALLAA